MKILFLTAGPEIVASSRTRVFQYIPYLKNENVRCRVIVYKTGLAYYLAVSKLPNGFIKKIISKVISMYDLLFSVFQTLAFVCAANYYDMLFIQKTLLPNFVIKFLKKRKKIIFDFDDAIYNDIKNHNKNRFDAQIALYDLIILENSQNEKYVSSHGNNNTLRITGPIDCKRYYPNKWIERDKVVIGWIGSSSTEKYFNTLKNVFRKLSIRYENLIFELVGTQKINFDGVSVKFKRWSLSTEVEDLQNFDIGIMPLSDNEWTRGKGGYKLLQYMSMGIPVVASPVGVNKEIIQEGINGFGACTEKEWAEKLSLLVESADLRRGLGANGRRFVEKFYSLESNVPKLMASLKKVCSGKDEQSLDRAGSG